MCHCQVAVLLHSKYRSKDASIRFWDVTSGVCVQEFSSHLGEVIRAFYYELHRSHNPFSSLFYLFGPADLFSIHTRR